MGSLVLNMDRLRAATSAHVSASITPERTKREAREAILSSWALPTPRSRSSNARALEPLPSPSSAICLPWSRSRSNSNRSRSALTGGASRSLRVSSSTREHQPSGPRDEKEPTHPQCALEILQDLCASDGLTGFAGTPPNLSTVPADWWRDRFYQRAMPGEDQDTKKHAFARASKTLIGQHKAGMANNRVWIVAPGLPKINRYGDTRDMSRFSRDRDDFCPAGVPGHGTRDIRI